MPISRQARMTRRAISPRLATKMRWNIMPLATGRSSGHVVGSLVFLASRCRGTVLRKRPFPSGNLGTAQMPARVSRALTRTDAEQRLTKLARISVLHKNLDDCSAALGWNLVEHFHRLVDADDGCGQASCA